MDTRRFLVDFARAMLSAIWRGFERTDTVIVFLIVFSFIWSSAENVIHDTWHPPGWVVTAIAAIFVMYHLFFAALRLYSGERSKKGGVRNTTDAPNFATCANSRRHHD